MNTDEIKGIWPGSCFGCSGTNRHGLQLRFLHTDSGSLTRISVTDSFCGFDGLVHGGIIATLLDEAAAWALFGHLGRFGLTREMITRYLKPIPTSRKLVLTGDVISHDERNASVTSSIRDESGTLLAEGESTWAFPKLSRIATLTGIEEVVLRQFLNDCCRHTSATPPCQPILSTSTR